MKSITIKKLYKLHGWFGIITGILLFVVAFTGAVAVFARPDIVIWANESLRGLEQRPGSDYQALIDEYKEKVPLKYQEEVHLRLAGIRSASNIVLMFEGHEVDEKGKEVHQGLVFEINPKSLELVRESNFDNFFSNSSKEMDIGLFISHFHADLHLGRPVGLLLTGLLGLTLMLSIVTGLFIHRKILKQLFTFRPHKSFSLMLNDGHKVMGVWGVLFHSVIAFTGAFLGLATVILVPAAAYVSFGGDQEKLIETFTAQKPPELSQIYQKTEFGDVIDHARRHYPDLEITNYSVLGFNDKNAVMYLNASGGQNVGAQMLIYDGANAEFKAAQDNYGRLEGVTGKILDLMFPLHFGNFAGVFVKFVWAMLGLATALLPITGLMLWIERGLNAQKPEFNRQTYIRFNQLLVGSCGGLVFATALLFPTQLLMNAMSFIQDQASVIFWVFFSSWLLITVCAFFVSVKKSVLTISYLTALCLIAVLPLDVLNTKSDLLYLEQTRHWVPISVDVVCAVLGLFILFVTKRIIPKKQKIDLDTAAVEQQAIVRS